MQKINRRINRVNFESHEQRNDITGRGNCLV